MRLFEPNNDKVIDFFVHEAFDGITEDNLLYEFFCDYFKNKIFKDSMDTSKLYLDEKEKSLQYSGRSKVEPLFEYMLLVNSSESIHAKRHYAEKGANFAIVHPVIHPEMTDNKDYYIFSASNFYSIVSDNALNNDSSEFFKFLSDITETIVDGLEVVIEGIKNDGHSSIEKAYTESVLNYVSEINSSTQVEYAKKMISFSRRLGIDSSQLPLKKEHVKYLLE